MTKVDYGGEGHHTRLKINDQLVCPWGAPSPIYKGVEEGEGASLSRRAPRESYSHREYDSPLSLCPFLETSGLVNHQHFDALS